MGKLEKIILWVSVVIAVIALVISLHNFGRINQNNKVINIVAETQEYIIKWVK